MYYRKTRFSRVQPLTHSNRLEIFFVVLFGVIGLGLFFWSAEVYSDIERPPNDAMTIFVVGKQWMWKLHQPNGREEINSLHVPVGQAVKLVMTSQDVIHSFYIPDFRIKQDVLPDRYTTLWFVPTKAGQFRIRCAEYCGTDHGEMTGWVYAMDPADYERWLSASSANAAPIGGTPGYANSTMATQLRNTFNAAGCIACHVPGASVRAPRLDGIWGNTIRLQNGQTVIGDEQYMRESILFPNAKISAGYPQPSLMPSYKGQLTEQQLRDLVEFIKSIRDGWPPEATTRPSTQAVPANGEDHP